MENVQSVQITRDHKMMVKSVHKINVMKYKNYSKMERVFNAQHTQEHLVMVKNVDQILVHKLKSSKEMVHVNFVVCTRKPF